MHGDASESMSTLRNGRFQPDGAVSVWPGGHPGNPRQQAPQPHGTEEDPSRAAVHAAGRSRLLLRGRLQRLATSHNHPADGHHLLDTAIVLRRARSESLRAVRTHHVLRAEKASGLAWPDLSDKLRRI